MLMGVECIKLACVSRMWLDWEFGESHISILLADAYGDSGWVGIKGAVAYGCLRYT